MKWKGLSIKFLFVQDLDYKAISDVSFKHEIRQLRFSKQYSQPSMESALRYPLQWLCGRSLGLFLDPSKVCGSNPSRSNNEFADLFLVLGPALLIISIASQWA